MMRWTIFLSAIWMFAGCSTPISIRERHHRDKTEPEEWLSRAAAASDSGDKAELRRTIGRFIVVWHKSMSTPVCGFRIVASPPSRTIWDPHYFDGFKIADDIDFRGLPSRHVRDGIGTPLVGWRDNLNRESIEKLYPPEGISRPVTAVLKFGPRPNRRGLPREVTVMLLKSQVMDSLDGRTLAADFSAPWAALLSRTKALRGSDLKGLLRADHTGRDAGMFLMEPYDPAKTPVVMVHGLLSTPLIWGRMTQELWADPAIRQRYQVWHYLYPTGLPFLYSAKVFREQLAQTRHQLNHSGGDAAMRKSVVLSHSMGGLLSKTLITDSGERIWNTVFTVPPSKLHGSAADRQEVFDILHWKAQPHVQRVFFIAVPHRGSRLASNFIGRFVQWLTVEPRSFVGLYARLDHENPDALRPPFRRALVTGRLTSINTLSPRHPILPLLNELPIKNGVSIHSIIGNRGSAKPLARTSDSIVPYSSSHIEAAASELIVPSDHGAYRHADSVREVRRVLSLP